MRHMTPLSNNIKGCNREEIQQTTAQHKVQPLIYMIEDMATESSFLI